MKERMTDWTTNNYTDMLTCDTCHDDVDCAFCNESFWEAVRLHNGDEWTHRESWQITLKAMGIYLRKFIIAFICYKNKCISDVRILD